MAKNAQTRNKKIFDLMASLLPNELKIRLVSFAVSTPFRIDLIRLNQQVQTLCQPFEQDELLLSIAKEQVFRSNVFFWPRAVPSIIHVNSDISYLEVDISITINGGWINYPHSFDLPASDAAKFLAIQHFFPKLESLTINVKNTGLITPGAYYVDRFNNSIWAVQYPEGLTTERLVKMYEILQRTKTLALHRWKKDLKLRKTVVFSQDARPMLKYVSPDLTGTDGSITDAHALQKILDWPAVEMAMEHQ